MMIDCFGVGCADLMLTLFEDQFQCSVPTDWIPNWVKLECSLTAFGDGVPLVSDSSYWHLPGVQNGTARGHQDLRACR